MAYNSMSQSPFLDNAHSLKIFKTL